MSTVAMSTEYFQALFERVPLMAILRGHGPERSVDLATVAWTLGIDAVEIPVQSTRDLESLAAVVKAGAQLGKPVGAGTIVDERAIHDVAAVGAAFTVSPGTDLDLVRSSERAGLPTLPGVATATDVQIAVGYGLRWLKAFPAAQLGLGWFAALKAPFPQVNFVATGGMTAANAAEFLDGGASVVAVGSALANPVELEQLAQVVAR